DRSRREAAGGRRVCYLCAFAPLRCIRPCPLLRRHERVSPARSASKGEATALACAAGSDGGASFVPVPVGWRRREGWARIAQGQRKRKDTPPRSEQNSNRGGVVLDVSCARR